MANIELSLPESIGTPATNALLSAGITTIDQAAELSDAELLALHGVGPKAIRILREYFRSQNINTAKNLQP